MVIIIEFRENEAKDNELLFYVPCPSFLEETKS